MPLNDLFFKKSNLMMLFLGGLLPLLTACGGFNLFDEKPANIQVRLVPYNQTLPQSFFDQSMAVVHMQHPRAVFRSSVAKIPYGDLVYSYIEYKPNPGEGLVHMHALITDHRHAWRIDERFKMKDRLKYRTRFNTILENIQRARSPQRLYQPTP